MTTLTGVLRENPLKLPKNEGTNYSIIMRREVAPRVAERSGAECWRKGGLVRNCYAGLVIWIASASHKRALGPLKESACGESGMRGRPIAPLVLRQQERAYLERQVRRHRVARSLSERCRAIPRLRGWPAKQASRWLPNSASTNTPLASGAAAF